MGLLDNLIDALLGALGIVKRSKPFQHTDPAAFKAMLQQKIDAASAANQVYLWIGCVGMREADFISGGIQGGEGGSFFSHVLTGIGEATANALRESFPFLLNNPKLPARALTCEIIESLPGGVTCQSMEKYFTDQYQMHIYGRDFTRAEAEAILLRAYATVGEPYDYAEIAKRIFNRIPDSDNLKVCSSATCFYFQIVERPAKSGVEPGFETPKDINEYLFSASHWDFFTFNIANR